MKVRRVLVWTILVVLVALIGALAWYLTLGPGDITPWLIQMGWIEDPKGPSSPPEASKASKSASRWCLQSRFTCQTRITV